MDTTTDQLVQHADFVRRLCRGLLSDADAADDVAQDTLAAALERPRIRAPRAWLAAVARRMAARHFQGEARRARRDTAAARRGTTPAADEIAAQAEMQRRIADEVRALDEPYRTVVILRYFHDLSPKEIARKLDAPYETVHSRLGRAHALLRRRLDETHGHRTWVPLPAALAWPRRTAAAAVGAAVVAAAAALAVTLLALGRADRGGVAQRAGSEGGPAAVAAHDADGVATEEPPADAPVQNDLVRATGRVTTLWGRGIPGARVVVVPWFSSLDYWERNPMPPAPLTDTTTAADGSFAVDGPLERGWALLAHAPGCAWTGHELALDVRRDFFTIRLPPGERLSGVVVDEAGARVRASAHTAEIPGAFQRTGLDGRFAFDGAYMVHVEHDMLAVLDAGGNCAPDLWRVVLGRGETVTGEVLAADGAPVPGAYVQVRAWAGPWRRSGIADGAGRFRVEKVPLRDGDRFTVEADGGDRGRAEIRVIIFAPGLHVPVRLPVARTVRGRVIEMRGANVVGPVPGIVVMDRAFAPLPSSSAVVTDEEGRFELGGVLSGDRIELVDFRFHRDWSATIPDLAEGEVGIVVRRQCTISGTVLDDQDRPVAGAVVRTFGAGDQQPWLSDTPCTPVSDERGQFRIPASAAISLRVWALKEGFARGRTEPLTLEHGEHRAGVVVKLDPGFALTGRVSDATGHAVVGALVAAGARQTHSNEQGEFMLGGLTEGAVVFWVERSGHQTWITEMAVPHREPLAVVLQPSLVFRGRLRTTAGEPLPHALLGRRTLDTSAVKAGRQAMQGDSWTRTQEDGSFAFRDLGIAEFALALKHRGWELADPQKTYDPATGGMVEVIGRPKAGGSITGRVLREDGQPFPIGEAPIVTAMPDSTDELDRRSHIQCRPDGSFTIENLEDGEHVLMVQRGGDLFEHRRVAAGATDVLIQPAKPRALSGRVLDAAGQPVSGCEVRAVPPGRGPLPTRSPNSRREVRWPVYLEVCDSDADGSFRFKRLVGEHVSIWAFQNGHGLAVETVATDQDRVELCLPVGLTLSGVLLDAGRRPLGEHQVIVAGADKMVRHAKTDANGGFALRGLPEGACDVSVMDKNGRLILETTLPAATEGAELLSPAR